MLGVRRDRLNDSLEMTDTSTLEVEGDGRGCSDKREMSEEELEEVEERMNSHG